MDINYAGYPQGRPCQNFGGISFLGGTPIGQPMSKIRLGIFFVFFMVATNLHINLFIKPDLNSAFSKKGTIVLIVFNKNAPIKIRYQRVYHEGGDSLIPTCVTQATIWGLERQSFL